MESIKHDENLYSTQCWENVRIMTGVRSEGAWRRTMSGPGDGATLWGQLEDDKRCTCLLIPALHHKVDKVGSIEGVWVLHDSHRRKSPIDRVKPKVRREVIHQVILALPEGESVAMARRANQRRNAPD